MRSERRIDQNRDRPPAWARPDRSLAKRTNLGNRNEINCSGLDGRRRKRGKSRGTAALLLPSPLWRGAGVGVGKWATVVPQPPDPPPRPSPTRGEGAEVPRHMRLARFGRDVSSGGTNPTRASRPASSAVPRGSSCETVRHFGGAKPRRITEWTAAVKSPARRLRRGLRPIARGWLTRAKRFGRTISSENNNAINRRAATKSGLACAGPRPTCRPRAAPPR
jgi:hypothetical protein